MKNQLHILIIFTLVLLVIACNDNVKNVSVHIEKISVTIPIEFEENEKVSTLILEYQNFANEFNKLVVEMIHIAGIDLNEYNGQINEQNLSAKQLLQMGKLSFEQSRLSEERDSLVTKINKILPTLAEPEQRALRGIIASIDAQVGKFSDSNQPHAEKSLTEKQITQNAENSQEGSSEILAKSKNSSIQQEEETRRMLEEREIAIKDLKDRGLWEEPSKSLISQEIKDVIWYIVFGLFILILIIKKRKTIKSRSSFFQRVSHLSSEIQSNIEKIPFNEITDNHTLSAQDKENLKKGESLIMDFIGEKTLSDAPKHPNLEEAGHIVSYENLQQFYNTELKPSLAEIEKTRKKIGFAYILATISFITALSFFLIIDLVLYLDTILGVIFLIVTIILFAGGITTYLKYRKEYKQRVVKKVVQLINPKFRYEPNKYISIDKYIKSKIFDNYVNKAIGDDYVYGKVDKTIFEFSEFIAQYEYEDKDERGKKVKRIENKFNGLFFLADFNKHIHGETFVMPDNAERLLGKFGQNFQKNTKGKLVKLENPEFEKLFAVFSTDQTEARYILTPAIMEGIVNLRKKIGRTIYLSFIGEQVYCAIDFNKALFEASVLRSVSFKDVDFMYSLFSFIEILINEMNLNTRIWTKT
jgi:hypothetical protein